MRLQHIDPFSKLIAVIATNGNDLGAIAHLDNHIAARNAHDLVHVDNERTMHALECFLGQFAFYIFHGGVDGYFLPFFAIAMKHQLHVILEGFDETDIAVIDFD